ncbi:hypothetical protein Enr13x_66820 [Stieleria neptunia]|uniref:DNA mimic protein DMP19 C-terminal domain-containing protein n=1 Tax=Stieleria neptunia TaxID=2527979 RepID=A0A518I101_9BACT|nr:hypothetical protein [Stieleria neptunia]QDV46773.1 hypothetical protein Enr13x_66820 [Stieleria neptunia]
MNDPSTIVAERFDRIVADMASNGCARPDDLAENDRTIYYIVSTRCEMDMGGFNSVFDQLLSESELEYLITCLNRLHATSLANAFSRAHEALRAVRFFDDNGGADNMISDFDRADGTGLLEAIEEELRAGEELWMLDSTLAVLP